MLDNFSRAFAGPQSETVQWGEMGWRLVCISGAGSSATTQLGGDSEKPCLSSEGPHHRWLKLRCYERGGVVLSPMALCFPKCLRRYGAASHVCHSLFMGKAPSFLCLEHSPFLACRHLDDRGVLNKLPLGSWLLERGAETHMLAMHKAKRCARRYQLIQYCP